ncbi:MAG: 4Fe-4S binding protein [Bacteroidales bacterium]|nr:4Fe-4S binding protein [Bacteroidales bacterium]
MEKRNNWLLSISIFLFVALMLSVVQTLNTARPLLLLERFVKHGGWVEVLVIALYAAFLGYKMTDPACVPKFRKLSWIVFSIVFFSQFILGVTVDTIFLMTGKLHLPIPMMVLAGPIYRGQLSIMPILFLSTIILTGPAWCSHYCYFGAIDSWVSGRRKKKFFIKNGSAFKWTTFIVVIFFAWFFRMVGVGHFITTLLAILFGLLGVGVIFFLSNRYGTMIHCTYYCPLGSLVNLIKWINPFRLTIVDSCTLCMRCTSICKYDALKLENLKSRNPGISCTLCGDCIHSCHHQSLRYKLFSLSSNTSRSIYLFLTISLHAIFLAIARI